MFNIFKKRFIKKGGGNNFNNHYAYFIRHQYGKEGGFKNYTPFSCNKIIQKSDNKININDHYGCPFKLFDNIKLKRFINKYYNNNINLDNSQHYQLQCKQMFYIMNKTQLFSINIDIEDIYNDWNHPNNYFKIGYDLQSLDDTNFKQKYHRNNINRHVEIQYNDS